MKILLLICSLLFSFKSVSETVYLTSLSWPPYADAELPEKGASVAVAKAAFQAMGHELVVDFFPWSRAVNLAEKPDSKYVGYFPEYLYESDKFIFSEPMGEGPLGFVEAAAKPISWNTYDDLSQYTIGVVQDYINTEELDSRIATGMIKASKVNSDDKNLLKVAAGRIDAAVIDANVFSYLIKNTASLKKIAGEVQMNKKLMVKKKLYVAFRNTPDGQRWLDIFNQGLEKVDVESIMATYIE